MLKKRYIYRLLKLNIRYQLDRKGRESKNISHRIYPVGTFLIWNSNPGNPIGYKIYFKFYILFI